MFFLLKHWAVSTEPLIRAIAVLSSVASLSYYVQVTVTKTPEAG